MRRLWNSCLELWVSTVDDLWVNKTTFPQPGFGWVGLFINRRVFGQSFLVEAPALYTGFFENNSVYGLFMHRFHSLNNMYYEKEN